MSEQSRTTIGGVLAQLQAMKNGPMEDARLALWEIGDRAAAEAIDAARNKVAEAMHCLLIAEPASHE